MNVITFALNDLRITARSKITLILLLVMPAMMIALMGYAMKSNFAANSSIEKFPVLYSNEDRGPIAQGFEAFLKGSGLMELESSQPEKLDAELNSGKYAIAIKVPEDLSAKVARGMKAEIEIISSGKDPIQEAVARSMVTSFTSRTNLQISISEEYGKNPGLADQSTAPAQDFYTGDYVNAVNADTGNSKLTSFQYFSVSMLIFFLLTTGMGVGTNILNERSNKTFLRIDSFPVTKAQYLTGKFLSNALIAIIQSAVIIVFAHYAFAVNWGTNYTVLALTILLLIFMSSGFGIVFSSLVNTTKALTSGLTILFWFMTFLSGGFTPLPMLDPVSRFIPNTWAFRALSYSMAGEPLSDSLAYLALLTVVALGLWLLGVSLYNRRVSHE